MKKLLFVFSLFFCLVVCAQQFPANEFFYTVPVLSSSGTTVHAEWWHEYMDQPQHDAFFKPLLDLVDNGTITAYVPEYPFTKSMSLEEVHALLHKTDTAYYDYGYLYEGENYYLIHHDITPDQIVSVSFDEEWKYDSTRNFLNRTVKGIILNSRSVDSDFPKGIPLFYIRFDGNGKTDILHAHPQPQVFSFTSDFHTRDYDHRIYSSKELFNGDSTMEKKCRDEASMIARSLANQKKIIFYDTLYPYNKQIDKKAIKKRLPEINKANTIGFMEDWYMDLNRMIFTKAIRGVVLEKEVGAEKTMGEWGKHTQVSYKRLAFVPTNNYKPELALINPFWNASEITIPDFIFRENFFTNPLVRNEQTVFADSAALMKMCTGICGLTQNGKLSPYYFSNDTEKIKLKKSETDSLFAHVHDTVSLATIFDREAYWETPFYFPKTNGLAFKEYWIYNPAENTFTKDVKSVAYLSTKWIGVKESFYPVPLFYVDMPWVELAGPLMKPEFLVAKNIHSPVMIDHTWETSGEDRGYSPQAIRNESAMDITLRYRFVQQIIDNALAGKLDVYDGNKTDVKLSPAILRSKIDSLKDSSFVRNDMPTDYLLFQELEFVEDWYFNPSDGEFYKKVKEIIFVNSDNYVSPYIIDFEDQKRVFAIKLN